MKSIHFKGGNQKAFGLVRLVLLMGIIVAVASPDARAQAPVEGMTLEQALQYAMKNSYELKSAAYEEQFAKEQVKEVRSQGLPQVNLSGRMTDNVIVTPSPFPALIVNGLLPPDVPKYPEGSFVPLKLSPQYSSIATAEATQLLYSQSYLVGLKAAKVSEQVSHLSTRKAQEDLAYNVSAAYYNAQISARQLEILQGNLERLRQLADISQVQYQNGILKKSDADRIKVNITNLETQIANLQTTSLQQVNLLKFLIGMPVTDSLKVVSRIDEDENVVVNLNRDENIFARRTDYQLLDKQRELYQLERKNVNAGYFPSLSAFGNFNYQAFRQKFNFFDTNMPWYNSSAVGLTLNVPVFDGLRKKAKSQQSFIRMKQTENKSEQLKQSITLDVVNANARLANARTSLVAQQENRQLAEQVYNQTQLQYKEGVASLSDLLNAETELRNAQNNYINALVQLKLAALELRKADGSLLANQ